MTGLIIVEKDIESLTPAPRNIRRHSKKQSRQIANSIERFGFRVPVLCDRSGQIVAGHGRVEAAKLLGLQKVPVILIGDLTREQLRALAIAENKLSERGGSWDDDALSLEIQELFDFDPTDFGFEIAEIDSLLGDQAAEGKTSVPPPDRAKPAVSRLGDIWEIGNHRLICEDATKLETYQSLMGDERAQMVFVDWPYDVPIAGHVSGNGRVVHPEFAMACGEMSSADFTAFLRGTTAHLMAYSVPGSIHFLCMDFRHMRELLSACEAYEFKNLCVWVKTNGGLGSFYRSQHELIFVMKSGKGSHINSIQLGKNGRNRTNVWRYGGANAFSASRDEDLATHPTVKPVELVADAIKDCSKRKGIVLDAFLGSGTTLVAAEQTGRRGRGIELDPYYVDAAVRRIAAIVGQEARLMGAGTTFDQVREERRQEVVHD